MTLKQSKEASMEEVGAGADRQGEASKTEVRAWLTTLRQEPWDGSEQGRDRT